MLTAANDAGAICRSLGGVAARMCVRGTHDSQPERAEDGPPRDLGGTVHDGGSAFRSPKPGLQIGNGTYAFDSNAFGEHDADRQLSDPGMSP